MNDSEKWQANPRLIFELPCVPFSCVCFLPRWGSDGSQSELTSITASASRFQTATTCCYDKTSTLPVWCVTVTDVTLAIDIDDMTHEVHLNAPMKSQFKQVNTPVADSLKVIEMFLLVQVNSKQARWHRRNITVVRNKFLVMIIKFRFCLCSSSIAKLLLLDIQISYIANLV